MLYFAYGSNLSLAQMDERCPGHKPLRSHRLGSFRLVLRGVANIEPAPDEHIDGAIYEITVEHGNVLDGFESVPETYDRRWFESEDGPVLYYQMVKARFVKPRERYVETIQRGYEDWSLPLDGLVRAIEQQRREYGSSERRS